MSISQATVFEISVECYAGYRGEETPRRFELGDRSVLVEKVLDQWLAPDHRYFKVQGDDGAIYIIRHDVESWHWELTFFKRNLSRVQSSEVQSSGVHVKKVTRNGEP